MEACREDILDCEAASSCRFNCNSIILAFSSSMSYENGREYERKRERERSEFDKEMKWGKIICENYGILNKQMKSQCLYMHIRKSM